MTDGNEGVPATEKRCHVMFHVFGADGEMTSYPADKGTQERWERIRQLILAKQAELVRRMPPRKSPPPAGKKTIIHYREPDWSDLDGWKQHHEWLRTEPDEIIGRDAAIEFAEMMIQMLEAPKLAERPAEAS